MSTSLPSDLETFGQHEVESGNFPSPDEVVSEGLRLLRERKLYELRREIDAGMAQIERGEGIELNDGQALREFFEDIKRRGSERLHASQGRPCRLTSSPRSRRPISTAFGTILQPTVPLRRIACWNGSRRPSPALGAVR